MPGSREGGLKAYETQKKRYGEDVMKRIGSLGGKKTGVKKGFAANPTLARRAGALGGRRSRKGAHSPCPSEGCDRKIWRYGVCSKHQTEREESRD